MNTSPSSEQARQVLAIVQASPMFQRLVAHHPKLLPVLLEAAALASARGDSSALIIAVARVAGAATRIVDAVCSGDDAELAKWIAIADSADEDLSRLLKRLCPGADPIDGAIATPVN
jgi:hypothetical protein